MEWSNIFKISCSCEIDSTKDDLFDALFNDNRYDVIMTDNEGNSVELKDNIIENHIKVTRRIPRKMKKMIKKRYGDMWLLHHPNTVTEVTFSRA